MDLLTGIILLIVAACIIAMVVMIRTAIRLDKEDKRLREERDDPPGTMKY